MKENQRIFRLFFPRHPDHYQPTKARTEKVARLRDAVRHGVYQVDARKVVQTLLKNTLSILADNAGPAHAKRKLSLFISMDFPFAKRFQNPC
ncbi:MAG: flagellar biosynthesis anti-sigma factor FlgM [Desulfobaccales bacterium]